MLQVDASMTTSPPFDLLKILTDDIFLPLFVGGILWTWVNGGRWIYRKVTG